MTAGRRRRTAAPFDPSCEVPDVTRRDPARRHHRFDPASFTWDGIRAGPYRPEASSPAMAWKDVVRHTLAGGPRDPLAFELRYFEIGPGGFSSLEKHAHAHTLLILRGEGTVIVGADVFAVAPLDLIYVPPQTPHQFINAGEGPFGFLCPVDARRDAPQPLDAEELAALLAVPAVRQAVRLPAAARSGREDPGERPRASSAAPAGGGLSPRGRVLESER